MVCLQHQILYLEKDNSLRDCLDELGDTGLNNSDIVRDYKKLGKRRQVCVVIHLRTFHGGQVSYSRYRHYSRCGSTFMKLH